LQAKEEPEGSSDQRMCLTLAERMVEKFYKEGKLEAEAEVLAYLYVLELQVSIFINFIFYHLGFVIL
jgi:hypothetical protein